MSHNWKKILISEQSSIKDALSIIDKEAMKLALVVDVNQTLLGTVTDGDIRRALIKNLPLSTAVSEIMNSSPITAKMGTPRSELLKAMEDKELLSIPILDSSKVVGLETLHQVLQQNKYDNPVFLMAGGFGTRLKPLTDNCPKPLLHVGDKPILETTLLYFISCGFSNFFISTHYLPEMIRAHFGDGQRWGVSIKYVHEEEPLGTGGALGLLPEDISELPVIIMNGDILTKINFENLLAFHNEKNAYATMCVREFEYQVPFGVVDSDEYQIKSMVEKPIQRFHVNAGIYVVSKDLINEVQKNERIDMPSLFERHLDQNVLVYPFFEYWLDIGRVDDFKRAQVDIQTLGVLGD
jgi:dTDP-glucose pyrophosphorylase/CBS domain-containing protein